MINSLKDLIENKTLRNLNSNIYRILEKSLSGNEINIEESEALFSTKDDDFDALLNVANHLRNEVNGNIVTYVINRNINFTNVCHMGCRFCNFAKKIDDSDAEWLSIDQIVGRAREAWDRGATEVCIQGGLHPKLPGKFYRDIILNIKKELPSIHIHAFSPFEIWYGAAKNKVNYFEYLTDLKECGLGSMPGTAAEILDVKIRNILTKNKLSSDEWIKIIKTAHKVGLKTTSTIMYGHVDKIQNWSNHLFKIREIQKETNGFTEFIPLSFVYKNSPLFHNKNLNVKAGPTDIEILKMHAVSRVFFHKYIDNIQVSWTKLGPKKVQLLLDCGVNDLGGTLMNESISRSAGSQFGQELTAYEMAKIIRSKNKIPAQRDTLYMTKEIFDNHDPKFYEPLVKRSSFEPLKFLN